MGGKGAVPLTEGIDVSSHQGEVDWQQVKAAGKGFAILRAGWSWYEGGLTRDSRFPENAAGAEAAGLPWGAYLYAYDRTPEAARASARRLGALLAGYRMEYPVAYDFEDGQYLSASPEENTAVCRAFLEELEGQGYYAALYTYANFAKNFLRMEELSPWDFWVAAYQEPLVSWQGSWGLWQYSAAGEVPGIRGRVDLDRARRDYPAIIRRAGLNGFGAGAERPEECVPRAEYQKLLRQCQELEARSEAAEATLRRVREALEE